MGAAARRLDELGQLDGGIGTYLYLEEPRLHSRRRISASIVSLHKKPREIKKMGAFGVLHSTLVSLLLLIVSFAFFNIDELQHTIWPTIILSKIIYLPFLERFDYIYVFVWFLIIISASCVVFWGGIRILENTIGMTSRAALLVTAGIVFILLLPLRSPMMIE